MSDPARTQTAATQLPYPAFGELPVEATELDRLLERTRRGFGVRMASIRVTDGADVQINSLVGGGLPSLEGETAFCLRTLAEGRPLIVPDTHLDDRFSLDPLVSGDPSIRFYAGIPIFLEPGRPIGTLGLFDTRPRRPWAEQSRRLADLAAHMTAIIAQSRDASIIERMKAEADEQLTLIRQQTAALAHSKKIFERASEAAKIGVWECDLPDETLRWTDVVYDIFELPRGSALHRQHALDCYSEESRKALEVLRSKAIAERGGFTLDAEITTVKGRRRWMRVTATVECENDVPVRIFGMKQDITEEKLLWEQTRYLAEFDVMTGLANRSQFQNRLADIDSDPPSRNPVGALMLVDLDRFKQVNDTLGHSIGDACLIVAGDRLKSVCGTAELVARIGGDEFGVLLGSGIDPEAVAGIASKIVEVMSLPIETNGHSVSLGASVGIACASGCTSSELFARADVALYAAKAAGRNTFRIYA